MTYYKLFHLLIMFKNIINKLFIYFILFPQILYYYFLFYKMIYVVPLNEDYPSHISYKLHKLLYFSYDLHKNLIKINLIINKHYGKR